MEIKKTKKGWEYNGILFRDERSALLTKLADEDINLPSSIEILPKSEDFQIVYDGTEKKSFGEFIERIIKENDITITKIAKDLNVSRPTLYSWMSGKSIPNELNLDRIKLVTGADAEEIFHALSDNFEWQKESVRKKLFELPKASGN